MSRERFDDSWKYWIWSNVHNGISKDSIFQTLLSHHFSSSLIENELNHKRSAEPSMDRAPTVKEAAWFLCNLPTAKALEMDRADIYVLDDFLSPDECQSLCATIKQHLRPSTITTQEIELDKKYRTSKTCDLKSGMDLVDALNTRISDYMGIDIAFSEHLQGQYYEVGNEFKQHTDYFEPGTEEFKRYATERGQRTWTFMIYLNTVEQGGETEFVRLGLSVKPRAGKALLWSNIKRDGSVNNDTLHWAKPVTRGEKFVVTKWFREKSSISAHLPYRPPLSKLLPIYSKTGFHLTRVPKSLLAKLSSFYAQHKSGEVEEKSDAIGGFLQSPKGTSPASTIALTADLKQDVSDAIVPLLEHWSGVELTPTFVFGIRNYKNGANLKMHVDRFETHVISAIINVQQQVNTPWALFIRDHLSRTHKVVLSPGDVLLYESARCAHGRPEPLDGSEFANIFVHAKPANWSAFTEHANEAALRGAVHQGV